MSNKQHKKRLRRTDPAVSLRSIHNTRRDRLLSLVGPGKRFASQNELATALELADGSYISQMIGPKPRRRFTEVVARRFEYRLKLPTGWLDMTE